MKPRCALCGRITLDPAVLIGAEPVGPKCAARAGLLERRIRSRSVVVLPRRRKPGAPVPAGQTPDLFEEVSA